MIHFFVSVNEGQKNIIGQQIIKVAEDACIFGEIYEATTEGIFGNRDVKVYVGKGDGKWNYLKEGLYDEISLMSELGLKFIRFIVQTEEPDDPPQQTQPAGQTAFDIMMEQARQPYFPTTKREDTQKDVLYNDIIALLKKKQRGGWSGNQESFAKTFVNRLVALLWYIDPHHSTLAARSLNVPDTFKELNLYRCDKCYNNFYFTGHHKKKSLEKEKLEHLAQSLELSIGQPWASEIKWIDFISQVFELTNIVKKYAKYLQGVNSEMNVRHNNNLVIQDFNQDLQVYTIEGSQKINIKYQNLSDFLLEKNDYEFVDLEEHAPSDPMQKYRYIKDLRLNFPIIIYRYHQGNYLGTLNYV